MASKTRIFQTFQEEMHGFYQQFYVLHRQFCAFILFRDFLLAFINIWDYCLLLKFPCTLIHFWTFFLYCTLIRDARVIINYEIFPVSQSSNCTKISVAQAFHNVKPDSTNFTMVQDYET